MWNPAVYLKFADERGRPFHDLVARIGVESPSKVVDLGCGPGNLTQTLAARWPHAEIKGVDSSPEMIAQARQATTGVGYELADLQEYQVSDDVEMIVSNATLQWVPGHRELLTSWVVPGRWIAVQVPGNFGAPGHLAMRALCGSPRWVDQLGHLGQEVREVGDPVDYARLLRSAGCEVDAWETTYVHQLPVVSGDRHPVLTWMSGTALRPIRKVLSDKDWESFNDELDRELSIRYPQKDVVDFLFRRVFVVAHRRR